MDVSKSVGSRGNYIEIPKLRQKLGVLYFNQRSITNDEEFGKRLSVSGRTIRHWTDGEKTRPPDMIGFDKIDRFVEIFRSCLPGGRSSEDVLAILMSKNVSDLLSAFAWDGNSVAWVARLHAAQSGGIKLIDRGPSDAFGLTSRRKPYEPIDEVVAFPSRHDFQFEFPNAQKMWIIILQYGDTGWFGVDHFFIQAHAERVLLPSSEPYFSESDQIMRTFAFLQSPVPFPPHLHQRLQLSGTEKGAVDVATLEDLAQFATSTRNFRINSLHVRFTPLD